MLESQLFGYRRGAFTGADSAFEGVIRGAAGGTLFLDEIGEIGPEVQPKLLRFLETGEIHPLGEPQPVKVDVRVIAATNANLETLMSRRALPRRPLLPPQRRQAEAPAAARAARGNPAADRALPAAILGGAQEGPADARRRDLEFLLLYAWPGNVRQLVNEVRRLVALSEADGTVSPALLSPEIQASRRTVKVAPGDEPEIRVRMDQPLNDAVDLIEQAMVRRALERADGNYENAARLLGISRKGLFLKRRRWGMKRAS